MSKRKNDIVCFDVETTGLSQKDDYVIQLACVKFDRNTFEIKDKRNWYIKPIHQYKISQGAFEAHGISKEWLDENGQDLRDIAPIFLEFIDGCDYLTYNGNNFDMGMVAKDLALLGYELPMEGKKFYDSYALECKKNPRNLSTIYKKYTGKDLDGAHDAFNDVKGTIEIFKHQMSELETDYDSIDDWDESNLLTPDGTVRRSNLNGVPEIVFAVGKHRDEEFMKVCESDYGYIKWYMENIATDYTKKILKQYYAEHRTK